MLRGNLLNASALAVCVIGTLGNVSVFSSEGAELSRRSAGGG